MFFLYSFHHHSIDRVFLNNKLADGYRSGTDRTVTDKQKEQIKLQKGCVLIMLLMLMMMKMVIMTVYLG